MKSNAMEIMPEETVKTKKKKQPRIGWAGIAVDYGVFKITAGGTLRQKGKQRILDVDPTIDFNRLGLDVENAEKMRVVCAKIGTITPNIIDQEEAPQVSLVELTPAQFTAMIRKLTDVIPGSLRDKVNDFNDPNLFAARSLVTMHENLIKELSKLGKPQAGKIAGSFMRLLRFNQNVFDQVMKASKPVYWKKAAEKLDKQRAALEAEKVRYLEGKVSVDEVGMGKMLRTDFRRFLGALHPDKHPGNEEKYTALFNDFKSYEDNYKG
jgi:hypothetical protein